jgi:hypothetical protein
MLKSDWIAPIGNHGGSCNLISSLKGNGGAAPIVYVFCVNFYQ